MRETESVLEGQVMRTWDRHVLCLSVHC